MLRTVAAGSDTPFFPDQLAKSVRAVDAARYSGALPPDADQNLLARNALTYLGMERPTTVVR
jgi:hypothetical protein